MTFRPKLPVNGREMAWFRDRAAQII